VRRRGAAGGGPRKNCGLKAGPDAEPRKPFTRAGPHKISRPRKRKDQLTALLHSRSTVSLRAGLLRSESRTARPRGDERPWIEYAET